MVNLSMKSGGLSAVLVLSKSDSISELVGQQALADRLIASLQETQQTKRHRLSRHACDHMLASTVRSGTAHLQHSTRLSAQSKATRPSYRTDIVSVLLALQHERGKGSGECVNTTAFRKSCHAVSIIRPVA